VKHLIISREYPPAAYTPGGIGAYVANIARLMAERGEIVHVIGERWERASLGRETSHEGRLIVHRIGADDGLQPHWRKVASCTADELAGFKGTAFPNQWFSWHAAFLIEWLIEHENIDVIEGQEWEAPLYYFLLRRALGIGPARRPPCIVHLHSTSEIVRHFNGALATPQPYVLMKRMEEYCIRAADALLCPSDYFARRCADRYGIPVERIKVIPLPLGTVNFIEREHDVWARGRICFVGRLEPRKGIIEWIEAAVRVAEEHPEVEFDVVGADIWGLQHSLIGRIPPTSRSRFRFHGAKPWAEIPGLLAGAKAAAVPSRWENFPNVCIEAMGTGLPVIATRLGGMVELVEDGQTGWLAPDTGVAGIVDGLVDALRRCLAASPAELASMGRAAAEAVQRVCNNQRTVDAQLGFRAEVARSGAHQSLALASPRIQPRSDGVAKIDCKGAGIIVRAESLSDASLTLESIRSQSVQPQVVAIVCNYAPASGELGRPRNRLNENTVLLCRPDRTGADAWNAGFEFLRARGRCGFWVFLDEDDYLLPHYISRLEEAFAHRPEVGVIAVWTWRTAGPLPFDAPLCPDPEWQLRANEVPPASAFRTEALGEMPPFRSGIPREYDIYDLANAVMARGWRAAAFPEILTRRSKQQKIAWPDSTALRALRAELLNRFSDVITPETLALVDDYVPIPLAATEFNSSNLQSLLQLLLSGARFSLRHPRRTARAVTQRARDGLRLVGSQFRPGKTRTVR
jgi:glycosyltransferase involved in cell wall biosynthesis